jgi:hypothetical protein
MGRYKIIRVDSLLIYPPPAALVASNPAFVQEDRWISIEGPSGNRLTIRAQQLQWQFVRVLLL